MSDNYFWYLYPDDVFFIWMRRRRTPATPTTTTTPDDDDDAVFGEARDRETNDDDHQSARHRAGDDERYVTRNETHSSMWIQSASTRGRRGQSWQDADVCATVSRYRRDGNAPFGRCGGGTWWWSEFPCAERGRRGEDAMVLRVMMSRVARARAEGKPRSRARGRIKEDDVYVWGGFWASKTVCTRGSCD